MHVDFECDLDAQRVGERVRRTMGKGMKATLSIVRCLAQVKTHRPSFVGTKRETVQRKVVNGDVNVPFRSTRGDWTVALMWRVPQSGDVIEVIGYDWVGV